MNCSFFLWFFGVLLHEKTPHPLLHVFIRDDLSSFSPRKSRLPATSSGFSPPSEEESEDLASRGATWSRGAKWSLSAETFLSGRFDRKDLGSKIEAPKGFLQGVFGFFKLLSCWWCNYYKLVLFTKARMIYKTGRKTSFDPRQHLVPWPFDRTDSNLYSHFSFPRISAHYEMLWCAGGHSSTCAARGFAVGTCRDQPGLSTAEQRWLVGDVEKTGREGCWAVEQWISTRN